MNIGVLNILEEFRQKAGCHRTKHKADKVLSQLKELIDENDYMKLVVGYNHFLIGESADELYSTCKELIIKYK